MLEMKGVSSAYGGSQVLFDIDFEIAEGEVVALMGRNGMGKTSLVRTLLGMPPITRGRGSIRFGGEEVSGWPSYRVAQQGIGLVPEGRQVFSLLSVEENLVATARTPVNKRGSGWTLQQVFGLFPRLQERRAQNASQLSGGEQQMLAIGRALMTNPRLLVLDEATEGLAPLVREDIWRAIGELRKNAIGILIIDQSVEQVSAVSDRCYVLEKGRVVQCLTASQLRADASAVECYLHI